MSTAFESPGSRPRLGDILVASGAIARERLESLMWDMAQQPARVRLGEFLSRSGQVASEQIARALAVQLGMAFVDIPSHLDPPLARLIPRRFAERNDLVPIAESEESVTLAIGDPTNVLALDEARMAISARNVGFVAASPSAIRQAIEGLYRFESSPQQIVETMVEEAVSLPVDDFPDLDELMKSVDDAPIIRLANTLFSEAVRLRATDIHLDPRASDALIRYRIDGLLRDAMRLPKAVQAPFTSRVKLVSGMDISEMRRPQDGRGRIRIGGMEVDTRVSTVPTMFGESLVVRLLPKEEETVGLEGLGMERHQLDLFREILAHAQGLVILTGPTGSGKTTTLYAALKFIASPQRNIVSLEDPVEYQVSGVNQVQVDERVGITFARGLRSLLRQDPDVIMVGEIRDGETAEIAMQASLTGHLVLTTLHTNDAASAVTRLLDIGVEPGLISSSLSLIVAQRLLRVLCEACHGEGCEPCGETGYLGRTGVFELIPMTRELIEIASNNFSESALRRAARLDGYKGLRDLAVEKAHRGITTVEEALRVTQTQRDSASRCSGCGAEVDPDFVACPHCGLDLAGSSCGVCGRRIQSDWMACPYCRSGVTSFNGSNGYKTVGQTKPWNGHE